MFDLEGQLRRYGEAVERNLLPPPIPVQGQRAGVASVARTGRRRAGLSGRAIVVAAGTVAMLIGVYGLVVALRSDTSAHRVSTAGVTGARGPVALSASPLSARSSPVVAWTGRSLLVWGGYRGDPSGVPEALLDGAEYSADGRWSSIKRNQWGHPGAVGVWNRDRLVVLAKNGGAEYRAEGTEAWRSLPELAPGTGGFVAVAASRGSVYGLLSGLAGPNGSIGLARLDPGAKTWRVLAQTTRGVEASSFSLIASAGSVDLWADGRRAARYNVERDAWEPGDGVAVPGGFARPLVTTVGRTVAAVDEGGARGPAILDPSTNQWLSLPGGAATTSAGAVAIGSDSHLYVWGGQGNPGTWAWDVGAFDDCVARSVGSSAVCSEEVTTAAQVAARLDAAGHPANSDSSPQSSSGLFGTKPFVLCVDRRPIQVYQYGSVAERTVNSDAIQPDGSLRYTQGDTGRMVLPEWIATPHFFATGRVIVTYVGDDVALLETLSGVLGPPIATDPRKVVGGFVASC